MWAFNHSHAKSIVRLLQRIYTNSEDSWRVNSSLKKAPSNCTLSRRDEPWLSIISNWCWEDLIWQTLPGWLAALCTLGKRRSSCSIKVCPDSNSPRLRRQSTRSVSTWSLSKQFSAFSWVFCQGCIRQSMRLMTRRARTSQSTYSTQIYQPVSKIQTLLRLNEWILSTILL